MLEKYQIAGRVERGNNSNTHETADEIKRSAYSLYRKWKLQEGLETSIKFGGLELDLISREVRSNGKNFQFTPKEFELFCSLAKKMNETVRSEDLMENVWGCTDVSRKHDLRVYIGYLRRKLKRHEIDNIQIHNTWKVGYIMVVGNGLPTPK